jgi:hypothetical protein
MFLAELAPTISAEAEAPGRSLGLAAPVALALDLMAAVVV